MQITDLLVPERVALNVQVADKAMAIHAMVGMLDRTGCLRDADEYEKNVLEREAQGTTGVGGGVAIPHGKSNAVLVPALAAVTLREPIDYQALDGAPVRLLFLIAAPEGANDLHIQVLARLAQLLMEPLFCEELKQAATPEEFLAVIAKREQGETAREARAEAVAEAALTEPRLAPPRAGCNGMPHRHCPHLYGGRSAGSRSGRNAYCHQGGNQRCRRSEKPPDRTGN